MNPIVIWHKWDVMDGKDTVIKPEFWMYKYRIPKIEEFVEGFKYEYLTLMITKPNGDIHVNFQKFIFGSEATGHSIEKIKQMLETGYIRVMNVYESNKTKSTMKLYYFDTRLRKLKRKKDTDLKKESPAIDNPIIGIGDFEKDQKIWYIVSKGTSAKDAFDNIQNQLIIKDNGFGETQKLLQLSTSGHNAYQITSGGNEFTKENLTDFIGKYEEIYVLPDSMHLFSELWPKNEVARTEKVQVKNQKGEKLAIIGSDKKIHPVYQIKPKRKLGKLWQDIKLPNKNGKVVSFRGWIASVIKTKVLATDNKGKVIPGVFQMKEKVAKVKVAIQSFIKKQPYKWTSTTKPESIKVEKSPNRLVCMVSKDKDRVTRIPWIEAEKLKEQGWEYIDKKAYKKVTKTKIGKSFTPANGDNGIYVPREKSIPNKSSVHNTHETINLVIPNKDREDLSIGKYTDYELDEQSGEYISVEKEGRGKYVTTVEKDMSKEQLDKYGNKIVPSTFKKVQQFVPITSDLVVQQKVLIKKKKQSSGGNKNRKELKEYLITVERHISDRSGSAEYVYTISAPSMEKAINRAYHRIIEISDTEYSRKNGNLILPHYKARGEEIVPENISISEKPNRSTLEPIEVKLHTPLIRHTFDDTGKPITEEVWNITKWIRKYNK